MAAPSTESEVLWSDHQGVCVCARVYVHIGDTEDDISVSSL